MVGYKIFVQCDDWDRSIEEYDGVIYEKWEDAVQVCNEANVYLDAYIEEVWYGIHPYVQAQG